MIYSGTLRATKSFASCIFIYNFLIFKDHSLNAEKARKVLESQLKEMQSRLDQAEANALKGSKRIIESVEHRVSF